MFTAFNNHKKNLMSVIYIYNLWSLNNFLKKYENGKRHELTGNTLLKNKDKKCKKKE